MNKRLFAPVLGFVLGVLVFSAVIMPVKGFAKGGADAAKYIQTPLLLVYFPTFTSLSDNVKSLLKRFYGKNYTQMLNQLKVTSEANFGINVLDMKELKKWGIDPDGPAAFIHIEENVGYLLISVSSKKKIKKYINQKLGNISYRFYGNYLVLTEKAKLSKNITNSIVDDKMFQLTAKKLGFNWEKPFVWVDSRYLSEASFSRQMTANMNLPRGFTAFTIDYTSEKILFDSYSGVVSDAQTRFIKRMNKVNGKGKFDILDYGWGHPTMMGRVYLNTADLYHYYLKMDRMNVLGLRGLAQELMKNYRINLDSALFGHADGRINLVVQDFNLAKNKYSVYGSIGLKNPKEKKLIEFVEQLKNAALESGNKLFAFEIFTYPFYHYKTEKYSLYYGIIEKDFLFSTDKDVLLKLVKNVFDNKNGFYKNIPAFIPNAVKTKKKGFFFTLDVQSLFNSVSGSGISFNMDYLNGIKNVLIKGIPDSGEDAYGWNIKVEVNFYK